MLLAIPGIWLCGSPKAQSTRKLVHESSLMFLHAQKAVVSVDVAGLLARAVVAPWQKSSPGSDHGAGQQPRYIHKGMGRVKEAKEGGVDETPPSKIRLML